MSESMDEIRIGNWELRTGRFLVMERAKGDEMSSYHSEEYKARNPILTTITF